MGPEVIEKLLLEKQLILEVLPVICQFQKVKVAVGVMKGTNNGGNSLQGDTYVLTPTDTINDVHSGDYCVYLDISRFQLKMPLF